MISPGKIKCLVIAGILLFLGMMVPGLWILDRYLSRPSRIVFAQHKRDLLSVHDALLRYEYENSQLPDSLKKLIPTYLRADQLQDEKGATRYRYSPGKRLIGMAAPGLEKGLFSRKIPPVQMALLEPDKAIVSPDELISENNLLIPAGNNGEPPPAGAYVFEAEHFSETNYGWELHPDDSCSGGAYLHCKEGLANTHGQIHCRIYDFYNIREKPAITFLRYRFNLPQSGSYYIYGRFWTTGSHCSNCLSVGIDRQLHSRDGNHQGVGTSITNRTPFHWIWTQVGNRAYNLEQGDHFIHLFPHEDGVKLDQFIISPKPITGNTIYTPNLIPGEETAWLTQSPQKIILSFDLKSMVITPAMPPECKLAIRRIKAATGRAVIKITLKEAGPKDTDLILSEQILPLADLPELAFLPINFKQLDFKILDRREYLLQADLVQDAQIIASSHVPLMFPFAWEVSQQLPYIANHQTGPFDGKRDEYNGKKGEWQQFKESSWDHFGVMDFGLQSIGNSLHAPQLATIYAKTNISVPQSATYQLKYQSDDQMILWIDGQEICRVDISAPVTRSSWRKQVFLEKGIHQVRLRVNQGKYTSYGDGRWQASLRFRTKDDNISAIVGKSAKP